MCGLAIESSLTLSETSNSNSRYEILYFFSFKCILCDQTVTLAAKNRLFRSILAISIWYMKVVMAFHEYGGNASGNVMVSLPQWVLEIGKDNPDMFFTDREGRRSFECLNWSIDKERVLHGRTGIEVLRETLIAQKLLRILVYSSLHFLHFDFSGLF